MYTYSLKYKVGLFYEKQIFKKGKTFQGTQQILLEYKGDSLVHLSWEPFGLDLSLLF